jgi:hypothetical protein
MALVFGAPEFRGQEGGVSEGIRSVEDVNRVADGDIHGGCGVILSNTGILWEVEYSQEMGGVRLGVRENLLLA